MSSISLSFKVDGFSSTHLVSKIKSIDVEYDLGVCVGEGSYGMVFRASLKDSKNALIPQETLALKRIDYADNTNKESTLRELTILDSLDHRNVLKLHRIVNTQSNNVYMVFDLASHDLLKDIQRGCRKNKADVFNIMQQVKCKRHACILPFETLIL